MAVGCGLTLSQVRLESKEKFDLGSVWLIDVAHLPTGCSVWPAIWTVGDNWPVNGEIGVYEPRHTVRISF
jgi:hypothetical protein